MTCSATSPFFAALGCELRGGGRLGVGGVEEGAEGVCLGGGPDVPGATRPGQVGRRGPKLVLGHWRLHRLTAVRLVVFWTGVSFGGRNFAGRRRSLARLCPPARSRCWQLAAGCPGEVGSCMLARAAAGSAQPAPPPPRAGSSLPSWEMGAGTTAVGHPSTRPVVPPAPVQSPRQSSRTHAHAPPIELVARSGSVPD